MQSGFWHLNIWWDQDHEHAVQVEEMWCSLVCFWITADSVLLHFFLTLAPTLRVSQRDAVKTVPVMTQVLKFLPSDSNHFFIGTNLVRIIHANKIKKFCASLIFLSEQWYTFCLGSGQPWDKSRFKSSTQVLQVSGGWSASCWCQLNRFFSFQTKLLFGRSLAFSGYVCMQL